jgi:6-pyruvoyltetrahydropterin/6-carboxytetrahydropterin synthase
MTIYAIRKIKFDAGHRVVNHESKCRTLHGHEYWAHIYAKSDTGLDKLGRVIDFSVIKEKIGGWIDDHFDHNMIIWKDDPDLEWLERCDGAKKIFVLDKNPTAENIAEYLIKHVCPSMLDGTGIKVPKIRLYETTNCYVEVEIDC